MRAVCFLAKEWLHTTPSRALAMIDEAEENFDVMLEYLAYDSFHSNWRMTSRENKIKFIQVVKVLRRQQGRALDNADEEHEAIFEEAQELANKHHGDPSRPPDDDLETRVASAADQNVNERRAAAPTFGRH